MKLTFFQESPKNMCSVVFTDSKGTPLSGPKKLGHPLSRFILNGEFGSEFEQMTYLPLEKQRVLFVNMGEKDFTAKKFRVAAAKSWKFLRSKKIDALAIHCRGLKAECIRAVFEGVALSDYQYQEFKTVKSKLPIHLKELSLNVDHKVVSKTTLKKWHSIVKGVHFARDLMLAPANVLYPETLAKHAITLASQGKFDVKIMDESAIKKEKMGALLSVSQGSQMAPRFIVMDYNPKHAKKTFVLVGKAVTFDSGGLSLKPAGSMPEMKGDMGGGATVFGIMSTLKAIRCPIRVIGLVPAVENMPSGTATRPSDVVHSRSGITIEINNTDAEGRLILADALDYAKKYKPDYVIDYATLTGACLVALGPKVCGIMGNCKELVDAMVEKGYSLDDPFWQLPLEEDYEPYLKSDIADVSNIASIRWGGAITAGLFLQRFAKEYKWAHCDIAASILEKEEAYSPKGGSGAGIRTTIEVFESLK